MTFPNYVRTLLLNEAINVEPDFFAEEYVSPDFRPRVLPTAIRKARGVLFGGVADRAMLNYRLFQLMSLAHSTELVDDITVDDDRITYLPLSRPELYAAAYPPQVTVSAGDGELTTIGELEADDPGGRIRYWWFVDVIDGTFVQVKDLLQNTAEVFQYTLTDGRSNLIPLIGSSLQFNFTGGVNSAWYVEAIAKPTRNLATIAASLQQALTSSDLDEIFGVDLIEPWGTWRRLWTTDDDRGLALTALILAIAKRTSTITEIA